MIKLSGGKLNIVIDGQFGSTGKGLLSNYIAIDNHIDFSISNAGPNAGHTFYDPLGFFKKDEKIVLKHLPISGLVKKRSTIFLCAGSIIDPVILKKEIEETQLDKSRLLIHPRAAVIEPQDIEFESRDNGVKKIASTMSGVGSALVRKINRKAKLAYYNEFLHEFNCDINLHRYLRKNNTMLMEVPQGMDLSLNHGVSYPFCTSRDISMVKH